MPTVFITIDPLPTLNRTATTFKADVDDYFATKLPKFTVDINTLATQIASVANDAAASALASANSATASAASAAASEAARLAAQGYGQLAEEALASSSVPKFVSGQTYAEGNVRYSPLNFETYRATSSGVRTTDPSLDDANWYWLGKQRAQTAAMLWAFALD